MVEFCVVNCFSCETYQGQQVKNGKNWTCKMCGEKQSFRQIFAQGSGKECRLVVQKLNTTSGLLKNECLKGFHETDDRFMAIEEQSVVDHQRTEGVESKWERYVSKLPSPSQTDSHKEMSNGAQCSFTTERHVLNEFNRKQRIKHPRENNSGYVHHNKRKHTSSENHTDSFSKHHKSFSSQLENEQTNNNAILEERRPLGIEERGSRGIDSRGSGGIAGQGPQGIPRNKHLKVDQNKFSKWSKYT